jgi:hypothetical protein
VCVCDDQQIRDLEDRYMELKSDLPKDEEEKLEFGMCMCVFVCLYVYAHAHTHIRASIHAHTLTDTFMHLFIHTYMHAFARSGGWSPLSGRQKQRSLTEQLILTAPLIQHLNRLCQSVSIAKLNGEYVCVCVSE